MIKEGLEKRRTYYYSIVEISPESWSTSLAFKPRSMIYVWIYRQEKTLRVTERLNILKPAILQANLHVHGGEPSSHILYQPSQRYRSFKWQEHDNNCRKM